MEFAKKQLQIQADTINKKAIEDTLVIAEKRMANVDIDSLECHSITMSVAMLLESLNIINERLGVA